jgi:hypothetical protein
MTTTYGDTHYCAQNRCVLRCAPRSQFGSRTNSTRSPPQPHPDVHLLPCKPPTGQLESAPRTALRADTAQERWEGFWGVENEAYYARCERPDGSRQWYRVVDEAPEIERADPKVLVLRRAGVRRANVSRMAVGHRGSRTILVGTSQRRSRTRDDASGRGAR